MDKRLRTRAPAETREKWVDVAAVESAVAVHVANHPPSAVIRFESSPARF